MAEYPALLEQTTQQLHSLGAADCFLVGRNETADLFVADRSCSRQHFRIVRRDGRYFVEPLNAVNKTYLNGAPLAGAEPLPHGALLEAGQTQFLFLLQAAGPDAKTRTPLPHATSAEDALEFPLDGVQFIGRDEEQVQICLPHPQVSRRHACIVHTAATATLTDLGSANGTFVNGVRIASATTLTRGDELDIGPYALRFTGSALTSRSRTDNVELVARGVTRQVRSRETGKPQTLLHDISLVIRPHEFVCLLGPSGSGKSTLLSVLSGRNEADRGAVQLNGKDLYSNFEALKQDIAVVPQKDVLHEALAVGDALWYTARLRLPPDTSSGEIESSVAAMLDTVGLTERRSTLIRHLSGGQVKRASLANEILCRPSLLFLDEVTSGLDEQTDRGVMQLFRSLADAGKTVVCITHSLANVERTCHLVVILTAGGKLACVGTPAEALAHFAIERLGDVYERLEEQPAEHWQALFRNSPLWRRYVADRLPPESRTLPRPRPTSESAVQRLRSLLRQTLLLTVRYTAIWRGDARALLAMAGQALVVAVLLGLLYGDLGKLEQPAERAQRSVSLLFLLAVSSYWFGCNNAAKEVVKERTIYTRERDFNLRVSSYYASKLVVLTLFSGMQALLLFIVVRLWCGPPGNFFAELLVVLALAVAGVTLGLAISTLAASEEMAITMIPLAVIPQIILSGMIAPLSGLSYALALLGISTYWGKRGLDGCLPGDLAQAYPGGLDQHSTALAVFVLLLHAAAGMVVALVALHWQSRRQGLRGLLRRVVS